MRDWGAQDDASLGPVSALDDGAVVAGQGQEGAVLAGADGDQVLGSGLECLLDLKPEGVLAIADPRRLKVGALELGHAGALGASVDLELELLA
jgi:hypothetical protein